MYKAIRISGTKRNDLAIYDAVGYRHSSSERFRARVKNSVGQLVIIKEMDNHFAYDGIQTKASVEEIFWNVENISDVAFGKLEYHTKETRENYKAAKQ